MCGVCVYIHVSCVTKGRELGVCLLLVMCKSIIYADLNW